MPPAQIERPRADLSLFGEKSRLRQETFRDRVAVVVVRFLADCRFGRGRSYASSLRRERLDPRYRLKSRIGAMTTPSDDRQEAA